MLARRAPGWPGAAALPEDPSLMGEVERVFNVLVDTGAKVSLVKAGPVQPDCLTTSRRPIRLKVAHGQYMVRDRKEAKITLRVVNHGELSRPDLGKEILLWGKCHKAGMEWDMIVRYDVMMATDPGILLAQASMTLYQDDQLSLLLSPEDFAECQWIHPEGHQLKVASLGTASARPTYQEYSVKPEVRTECLLIWEHQIRPSMCSAPEPPPIVGCVRITGAPRSLHRRSTGVRVKV